MKLDNGKTLVEQNLADWPEMSDKESSGMLSIGDAPCGEENPRGIWCWDIDENQVLVGERPSEASIITYEEVQELYSN